MFELYIATVLVDGSEHDLALTMASLLEFEAIYKTSIIKAVDDNLSMEYLVSLSYLSLKGSKHVCNIETHKNCVKGVSYRVERIPFGEKASTVLLQD